MDYLGKEYKFEKDENIEEFVKTLDLTPEKAKAYLANKPSQKLEKDGDGYILTMGPKVLKFKSGVEFDEETGNHTSKTTITVDGNKVTQIQKYGNDFFFTFTREYSGDTLVWTAKSNKWNGEARRYFKA